MSSNTPLAGTAGAIDEALMRFPYNEWIPMPQAAALVRDQGLDGRYLTTVVRTGRRRGVLRTRRTPYVSFVMRVHEDSGRRPAPTL